MLAKLFVILALTNVAFSSKNLRKEPAEYVVVPQNAKPAAVAAAAALPTTVSATAPLDSKNAVQVASVDADNKRAAAILKSMTKKGARVQKSDSALVRERAQSVSAKGRHEIKMNSMSISGDKATQGYVCDQGWQTFNNMCYYSGIAPSDYQTCQNFCVSIGSTMACVEDSSQNDYLMSWQGQNTWLGYDDLVNEGSFAWPAWCPSSYSNWKQNEPDNGGGAENCAIAEYSSNGAWLDASCVETAACVCERGQIAWVPDPVPWDVVTDGYYITRHRPNGDCSGISTMVTAQRVGGTCHSNGNSTSYMEGCNRMDSAGMVSMATGYFNNGNCEGSPYYISHYGASHEECEFDLGNTDYRAPAEMLNVQCTDNAAGAFRKGGFATFIYEWGDDMCQAKPSVYALQKYGACTLSIEYDDESEIPSKTTTFTYTTIDSCTHDGMMTVTGYSDPACTRRLFSGSASIADVMPDFNSCQWDAVTGASTRSVCLAPGSPPPF